MYSTRTLCGCCMCTQARQRLYYGAHKYIWTRVTHPYNGRHSQSPNVILVFSKTRVRHVTQFWYCHNCRLHHWLMDRVTGAYNMHQRTRYVYHLYSTHYSRTCNTARNHSLPNNQYAIIKIILPAHLVSNVFNCAIKSFTMATRVYVSVRIIIFN